MPATEERINKLYKKGDMNVDAAMNANESKEARERETIRTKTNEEME